jgi:hypothetical protein
MGYLPKTKKNMMKITTEEKSLIDKIINLEEVRLDVLYLLKEITIPTNWSIQISPKPTSFLPVGRVLGYISFSSNFEDEEILHEFNTYISSKIISNDFKTQGLLIWLLLIDRIGHLHDDEQYNAIEEILNNLDSEKIKKLIAEFITALNSQFSFRREDKIPDSVKDWRELENASSYYFPFDNPVETLHKIIFIAKNKINLLAILGLLNPEPRASLLFLGTAELIANSEIDFINFINNNPSEITFIVYLILQSNKRYDWIGEALIAEVVNNHWRVGGKLLFRDCFASDHKSNDEIIVLCKKVITNFFEKEFSNELITATVINNFEWPIDFVALGGWIRDHDRDISLNKAFVNDLVIKITHSLNQNKDNISNYLSNSYLEYEDWFREVLDPKVQIITSYLLWSSLLCEVSRWDDFVKAFTNLCYEIKTLFYGSYNSMLSAKKLSNRLIIFFTSIPKSEIDKQRTQILSDIFTNIVSFPWIRQIEREESIWNNKEYEPNYLMDSELLMVIINLRKIYFSAESKYYEKLFAEIKNNSTTPWPIFYKKNETNN